MIEEIRTRILKGEVFEINFIPKNIDLSIINFPYQIKRNPRGIHCGIVNPLPDTLYKYNGLNTTSAKFSNHPIRDDYILFDLVDEKDKESISNEILQWTIDINTLNLHWECTHSMTPSVFYVERYGEDFEILFLNL